jgi:dihydrofolate synthase/folylpolyglutamate synthase
MGVSSASEPDEGYAAALGRLLRLGRFGVRMGLEPTRSVLARLGDPHRAFASVHLAGSNGKGSTAAMLAACLRAAGLRTGLYTSPHLCRFTERIEVDGGEIPRRRVAELVERVLALDPHLTFFETATAVALLHFAEAAVEVAVLETGLGGRLDATNVVTPRVSILTRIALDHTEILGTRLVEVAGEKAGIVKPGVPAVSAPPASGEVETLLRGRCAELGAPLRLMGRDFDADRGALGFGYRGPAWQLDRLSVALPGEHQLENAALCLAALEQLQAQGLPVTEAHARQGLSQVRWPGRMEWVGERFLLDGAHNPAGAAALAGALQGVARCCLVFGALGPRDVEGTIGPLLPRCGAVILTRPRGPRGIPPEELARRCGLEGRARLAPDLPAALELAADVAGPVLITGSLYLVGEARQLLLGEPVDPVPTADPLPAGK